MQVVVRVRSQAGPGSSRGSFRRISHAFSIILWVRWDIVHTQADQSHRFHMLPAVSVQRSTSTSSRVGFNRAITFCLSSLISELMKEYRRMDDSITMRLNRNNAQWRDNKRSSEPYAESSDAACDSFWRELVGTFRSWLPSIPFSIVFHRKLEGPAVSHQLLHRRSRRCTRFSESRNRCYSSRPRIKSPATGHHLEDCHSEWHNSLRESCDIEYYFSEDKYTKNWLWRLSYDEEHGKVRRPSLVSLFGPI